MQEVFKYPRARHIRSHDPRPGKPYADYRSYKPALRAEFSRRCVYCRRIDEPANPGLFHVDHYKPQSIASELTTTYSNLFYACAACNTRKGDYWMDPHRPTLPFLPNPCDHVMSDHLRFEGPTIFSRGSKAGDAAIRVLDLKDPTLVAYREFVIRSVERIREEINTRSAQLRKLRKEMKKKQQAQRAAKLAAAAQSIEAEIEQARSDLAVYYGLEEQS